MKKVGRGMTNTPIYVPENDPSLIRSLTPDETSSFWEALLEGLFIFGLSYFTIKNIKVE